MVITEKEGNSKRTDEKWIISLQREAKEKVEHTKKRVLIIAISLMIFN